MIKKIWIFLCFSLFVFVVPCLALEYQGQTITAQDIKNLPPGTIESLPPGTQEQVKQAISSDSKNIPAQTGQKEMSGQKKITAPDALKPDALQKELPTIETENATNKLTDESETKEKTAETEPDKTESDKTDSDKTETDETESDIAKMEKGSAGAVSIIEQQYRKGYSSALSSNLKQFGYDFFTTARPQQSSLAVPDPSYVLGTGDQLLIRLWGSNVDAGYSGMVDREGTINVPKIGMVHLAGVKYGDVEAIILKEAEKYIQGINISVSLTKLRSFEVYVVGAVRNPGLHIVPSFSTILDALQMAGGVKKSGSLRQIKLNRGKKQLKVLDVYDLLLKGNRGADEILQNKDVIFVPGIGKTAAVAGAVNNEGIFELTRERNVQDLVQMAGGLLPQAFGSRIYLRRFENNQSFVINDINTTTMDEWEKIAIQNGDLVELTFSSSLLPNVVKLEGHVWSPDVFQFKEGMKLSDILTMPTLLMPDAITDFALIYRYDLKTTRVTPIQFPLSKVFTGQYDKKLHPFDTIKILSRAGAGIKENFSITGAVWKPGEYEYRKGLKLKDALALSGGLKPEARTDRIEIKRKIKTSTKFETKYIKLNIAKHANFVLKPDDRILIPRLEDYFVSLEGHVWYPEKLRYHTGMKLSDVLISKDLPKPEDMLKPDTVTDFALLYRYDAKTTRTIPMKFPLSKVFTGEYDAQLQPFDRITILSRAALGISEKFSMTGAVWKPGEYDYKEGLKLKDAFALAGGLKPEARTDHIEIARKIKTDTKFETEYIKIDFTQNSGFLLKPEDKILIPRLEDYFVSLEGHVRFPEKMQYLTGMKLSDVLISRELAKPEDIFLPDVLMEFGLIYRYDPKTTRTTAIRFPLTDVFNGTHDELLQPFDRIQVLSRKDLGIEEKFSITGSVWKQGEFEFQPGLRLKDALALAGGMKFGARTNKVEIARQQIKGNFMQTEYIVLDTDKDGDFILKPNDSVLIPGIKNASLVEKVTITGEVAYPGTYTIRQGEKVSDLIQRAGGFSEYAYFYGAKYTSQKARVIQQKSIDQMIEKLKLSIMQTTSGKAQTALDAEDAKAAELTGAATQSLLDQLTSIKAEGRISIKLADLISFKDSLYDFRLKHEDTIDIPTKPSFISVVGSVYSPGSFLYEPNQSLKFYLSKSGGIAKTADEDYMYVLKANGEIMSMSQNNGFFSKFVNTTLMPGDTIVVPENLERIGYLKLISDISDIVFKIATTAGVAVALSL